MLPNKYGRREARRRQVAAPAIMGVTQSRLGAIVLRVRPAWRHPGSRRIGWSIVDQGLSSASNLALALAVARSVPSVDFGAFGLAIAAYILAIGIGRAVTSEPFLVRHSTSAEPIAVASAQGSAATSVLLGLVCASLGMGGALGTGDASLRPLLAVSAFLPALLLQDHWRYVLVALRRPRSAAFNDLVWLLLQLGGTGILIASRYTASPVNWIVMWGASGSLCAVVGSIQSGSRPRMATAISWWRAEHHLMTGFLAEFAVSTGSAPVTIIGLGAISGLRAVAGVRGAQTLFGPFYVVSAGALLALIAEGSRFAATRPRRLPVLMTVAGALLGVAAVSQTAVLTVLPTAVGRALLGDSWAAARRVVPLYGIGVAFSGATIGAISGLRSLKAVRISVRCRLLAGPLLFALPLIGAAVHSTPGYLVGWFAAAGSNLIVMWSGFYIALHPRAAKSRFDRRRSFLRADSPVTEYSPVVVVLSEDGLIRYVDLDADSQQGRPAGPA